MGAEGTRWQAVFNSAPALTDEYPPVTKRQAAFLLAKIGFAVGVLMWLSHKVDAARVLRSVRYADRGAVTMGVLVCLSTVVVAGWRWQRLLAIFGIHERLGSLICIAQIGQFFMMFLPGPTGDDLTRMLYISRLEKGRRGEACTTVVIDRILGLSSILVLAVLCIPWQWELLAASRQTHLMALGVFSAGIGVCVFGAFFFFAGHPTHRWFEHRLRSLPAHNLRDEVARIWGVLCANKRRVAEVLAAALATQLLLCSVLYFAGVAVGIGMPLVKWLSFAPIVLASNAVPITVAGIGVREYLLVLFLGVLANVGSERALATSFVSFSMLVMMCLSGGVVYVIYRPRAERQVTDGSA